MQAEAGRGAHAFGLELVDQPAKLSAILQLLITRIEQNLGPAPAVVFMYDPDSDQYTPCAASQAAGRGEGQPSIPCNGALVAWLEACTEPICAWPDQSGLAARDFHPAERQAMDWLDPALFCPLRSWSEGANTKRELGGWIAIGPRPSGQPYSPDDLSILASLVSQAALVIENARLRQAVKEAEEGRSEFIDFVAHELKQPMTAIQGYAKMLTLGIGGELTDTQRQFARVIGSNAERMGRLVNNLLEVSRLEAGRISLHLAAIEAGEIVGEAIAATQAEVEARYHALAVEIPADLPPVLADRDRLLQILINLISNAYKYTPEGGRLRITVGRLGGPEAPAGSLRFSVSDSGIGMSDQELARVGEKFFRAEHELVRSQPGSGVGVSIVQQLIALHGGQLTVRSDPGKGSTFSFTLPIAGA